MADFFFSFKQLNIIGVCICMHACLTQLRISGGQRGAWYKWMKLVGGFQGGKQGTVTVDGCFMWPHHMAWRVFGRKVGSWWRSRERSCQDALSVGATEGMPESGRTPGSWNHSSQRETVLVGSHRLSGDLRGWQGNPGMRKGHTGSPKLLL